MVRAGGPDGSWGLTTATVARHSLPRHSERATQVSVRAVPATGFPSGVAVGPTSTLKLPSSAGPDFASSAASLAEPAVNRQAANPPRITAISATAASSLTRVRFVFLFSPSAIAVRMPSQGRPDEVNHRRSDLAVHGFVEDVVEGAGEFGDLQGGDLLGVGPHRTDGSDRIADAVHRQRWHRQC